jgi:hypothetical protein
MLLNFTPPGPVSAAFLRDRSFFSAIMGPIGSAKTSTCVMKSIHVGAEQRPSVLDGVRYTRGAVVRDTYRNLSRTTLPTFKSWLPKGAGQWTGGGNEPAQLHLRARMPDGTRMDMEVLFVALGDQSIEDVARGWELTWFYLNEADRLPEDVKTYLAGRVGRYPSALHGGASWRGGFADYNAPDVDNWLYRLAEESRPDGHAFFRQPGGREAGAENLENLPPGYYEQQAAGAPDWYVRRMIDNLYGYSRDGKPVYPEWRDDWHCAGTVLQPVRGLAVKVSLDQGLHPAAILRQTMPNGQRRVLDELVSEGGAQGLAQQLKALMASDRYRDVQVVGGRCDPAAAARDGNDAESWVDCFNRLMGWSGGKMVRLADTNDPEKRQSAVRRLLKMTVDDGRPALLVSSGCRFLRKGFNSDYRFKRMRVPGVAQYADAPEKRFPFSDVHDALQYDALDEGGFEEVVGRERRRSGTFGSGKMITARENIRL